MEEIKIAYYNKLAMRAAADKEALHELYEVFFPRVYNFIYARTKNAAVADDIVSDTFLKAVKNIGSFDSQLASFSTWLFRIANNTLYDYTKWKSYRQDAEWDDNFGGRTESREEPEGAFFADEDKKMLLAALKALNEREQKIVELKYFSDLSQKEIAVLLEITQSNVGVILHRALGKLRKKLENEEI